MAEMEAHNQREITQRQRAERLLHDLTHVDTEWKCCLEHPQSIEKIMAFAATARQEAMREGMELAAEEADMHVCDDPRYCHCSSKIYKAVLDRLAREGVRG